MHCPERQGIREKVNSLAGNLQWYCSGNKEDGKISSSAIPTATFKAPSLLIMPLTNLLDTSFCLGCHEKISTLNHIKQEKSKQ